MLLPVSMAADQRVVLGQLGGMAWGAQTISAQSRCSQNSNGKKYLGCTDLKKIGRQSGRMVVMMDKSLHLSSDRYSVRQMNVVGERRVRPRNAVMASRQLSVDSLAS